MKGSVFLKNKCRIASGLIIIGWAVYSGCESKTDTDPAHMFGSYRLDKDSSLASRVTPTPRVVLNYLMKLDNRTDYEPYTPNGDEMKIVDSAIASLPATHKNILQKRLVGVYFIRNFFGNGLADWVVDTQNTVYAILVFNAGVFSKNLSELLTEKEKTCFQADDPAYDIRIDCGKKYNGFYYILAHEATHAVDYVTNITPYTDRQYRDYMKISASETEFTKAVWSGYDASRDRYVFSNKVFFYGSPKPQLRISESETVYKELARSPFASLYGSQSWAEDLAELAVFYHITGMLGQPYCITVTRKGKPAVSVRTMESQEVRKRLPLIQQLYRDEAL
jgi:hypothetical protein